MHAKDPKRKKALKSQQSTFFPDGVSDENVMQAIFFVLALRDKRFGGKTGHVVPDLLHNPLAGMTLKFVGVTNLRSVTVYPHTGKSSPAAEAPPLTEPE